MTPTMLINPQYERLVRRHGLDDFERVMHWQGGQSVGRHAKRDIERITIDENGEPVRVFLKRERQTYLKDRLKNWIDGLGWGTKSRREWQALSAMTRAGVGCPEPLVIVERRGFRPQGYLVLREIPNVQLLGPYLAEWRGRTSTQERRQFAEHLGREVARLHAIGVNHPDLFSKHILLRGDEHPAASPRVWFIDMQRSSTQVRVSIRQRIQDIAALDATIAQRLASETDRLAFLRAYLAASDGEKPDAATMVSAVRRRSQKLQGRRKIREMRGEKRESGVGSRQSGRTE
jgi:tRNA A-37 threonylcarbamoyl transferase component Bud32